MTPNKNHIALLYPRIKREVTIMMKSIAALYFCLFLAPISAGAQSYEDSPETVSIRDTTLLEVREAAVKKVKQMQTEYVRYGATPDEQKAFNYDVLFFERDVQFFKGPIGVSNADEFRLKMVIRMALHLNTMNNVIQEKFEEQRAFYCHHSVQPGLTDEGVEAWEESHPAKRDTPKDKADLFCTIHVPSFIARM
jgi:hypothetical protein